MKKEIIVWVGFLIIFASFGIIGDVDFFSIGNLIQVIGVSIGGSILIYYGKKTSEWFMLIKWIIKHRLEGNTSFRVVTNSDTFIITVEGCESTRESWDKNMLRIEY